MARVIPDNIPSRSDVPDRLNAVARYLKKNLPDEVIVWLEWTGEGEKDALRRQFGEQRFAGFEPETVGKPYLVVLDPEAGIVVLEVPASLRGRRGTSRKLRPSDASIREIVTRRSAEIQHRLGTLSINKLPVAVVLAIPDVPRGIEIDTPSVTRLHAEDFTAARLRPALHAILDGGNALSESEVAAARAAVNPDIVIKGSYDQLFSPEQNKEILRTLDLQQEQLAIHLGSGYRLIRGVAGSGKTLVLVYRARHLAKNFGQWDILLLCYNKALSLALEKQVERYSNIHVKTLDAYARGILVAAGELDPKATPNFDTLRSDALRLLSDGRCPDRYDVVLVDEAQDLDEEGLSLAWALLKDGRDHFVIALDGAQRINGAIGRRRLIWNPPGQTASGRTTVLKENYRNTREILEQGWELLLGSDTEPSDIGSHDSDDLDVVVKPEAALRRGPIPRLEACPDSQAEAEAIVARVRELREKGATPNQIAVLIGCAEVRDGVLRLLDDALDTSDWRLRNAMFHSRNKDKVVAATLGLLKGLEYKHVIIGGANHIEIGGDDVDLSVEDQRRLLYVAITRATETLTITSSGDGIMSGLTNVPEFTR